MSKQQALDADPKARKQINFTGNSNWGRNADFEIINANTTMFFIIEEAKENANTTMFIIVGVKETVLDYFLQIAVKVS